VTEAAQAVQRSGFPDAYAKHEPMARSFASALTGNSPAALTCVLRPANAVGSAAEFAATFAQEWGPRVASAQIIREASVTPSPDPLDSGARVVIAAESEVRAWAAAEWSVAKASQLLVQAVAVDGWQWNRQTGKWVEIPSDAEAPAAGQVIVTLA
jgi:hypothetical protein